MMKLLPSGKVDVAPTSKAYEELAAQLGLPLIECGQVSAGQESSADQPALPTECAMWTMCGVLASNCR